MDTSARSHQQQQQQQLGVNKMGKSIKKSPLHQPNFVSQPSSQPQPQVYNINKSDFRSIVQRLTGTGSSSNLPPPPAPPASRPPQSKHSSHRLQRIRPPPLAPISRPLPPTPPLQHPIPNLNPPVVAPWVPRPGPAAESPVSAYMRYLESSLLSVREAPPHAALPMPPAPSPSPLPPSPSGFLNLLSPRSPYPLLSPGFNRPPPLTPNFAFSPLTQSGMLGPGGPQMPSPLSPGFFRPPSPSGFLPLMSPTWRELL